ncbi:MAG: SpoIID/LytB domain-containing protein [Candidatus Melainabacteria bacterium]|nr:SpoIID/LytB domain-containing protein [Candidatus Melainabacteria bacterium]
MLVAVGLTTTDLKTLDHTEVVLTSSGALEVFQLPESRDLVTLLGVGTSDKPFEKIAAGQRFTVKGIKEAKTGSFVLEAFDGGKKLPRTNGCFLVRGSHSINLLSIRRPGASGTTGAKYNGSIAVFVRNGHVRVALILDLDKYLNGVLHSEIPASYHIEAVKAQAVAARTYGLNPRISHGKDGVNVCDSYLCCQYFGGLTTVSSPTHERAIHETLGEVLTYREKPILALFSSCAGGHTENYNNCFSDPATGQFPPPELPYLSGVPETKNKVDLKLFDDKNLRHFYNSAPYTVDAASNHFKWKVHLTADDLESHMHATVQAMLKDERAPFVVAPPSGKFGHIESFRIPKRGVSGCAIEIEVKTSTGTWRVMKELVIRDLFKTPGKKLARLKSARIFLDQSHDKLGHLSALSISGLGWGHGVGLQQTGAQGWAKEGSKYQTILAHYFTGAKIEKV